MYQYLKPHILVAYAVRIQVTDGEVYAVRIVKAGSGCKAPAATERHTLEASCPSRTACQRSEAASQLVAVAEVKNGAVVRVSVIAEGRGYLNKPLLRMPASAACSEAPVLEAAMLYAHSDLLVQVHPRHYCQTADTSLVLIDGSTSLQYGVRTACVPDSNGARSVLIKGIPRPLFIPKTFPGEGLVFRPPQLRLQLDARTRLHDAAVVPADKLSSGTNSQASLNRALIFIEP